VLLQQAPPVAPRTLPDERAARRTLLDQVARLEQELAGLFCSVWPRKGFTLGVPGRGGPRLLSLAELEQLRDDLAGCVQHARRALSDRTYTEEQYRRLIEEMLLDPAAHQRGHRGARLQALARAPALELHRHAHGLVARRHQLRLPVSHLTWGAGPASAAA